MEIMNFQQDELRLIWNKRSSGLITSGLVDNAYVFYWEAELGCSQWRGQEVNYVVTCYGEKPDEVLLPPFERLCLKVEATLRIGTNRYRHEQCLHHLNPSRPEEYFHPRFDDFDQKFGEYKSSIDRAIATSHALALKKAMHDSQDRWDIRLNIYDKGFQFSADPRRIYISDSDPELGCSQEYIASKSSQGWKACRSDYAKTIQGLDAASSSFMEGLEVLMNETYVFASSY
jgi:hypothetical protein